MSAPVQIGETLAGKYTVERVLGVGGMGVVVAARHIHLGERVAIKFLLPQALAQEDVVERFKREGQAAAKMRSEHIARVRDTGTLDSGAPYLVMEYLDGQDLGAALREKGSFPIAVAVDYVLQTCEALADAHAAGVIHRDLKPGNLFLTRKNDGSPVIKVIDFGISKLGVAPDAGSPEGETGEMTKTAMMMGSPYYMAPEQMASARDVDARSDIWSLGVILHTLLTGTPPFKAPSVMEIYELILAGAPPLRSVLPGAPEGLEAILLRCLKKPRAERYDSVAELAAALVEFGPPGARESAERSARILRVNSARDRDLPPVDASPIAVAATPAAQSNSRKIDPPSVPSHPSRPSAPLQADPSASQGPWDRSGGEPAPRRAPRSILMIGSAAAIVLAAGIFALVHGVRSPDSPLPPSADPSPSTTSTSTSAPAATIPAPTLVAPGPTATIAPSVTAPVAATPSATASPAATIPRGRPPAARPPPAPADPFGGSQK